MENLTDEWLAASAALALVSARNGAYLAETSICERAHAGLIKARASLLIRPKSQNLGAPKDAGEHNCAVPKEFWGPKQGWEPTWATGDFATWLDKLGHWKAFGVVFDRAGIEGMLRPLAGAGEASHFLPDGRPSDSADVFSRTAFVVKDADAYARGEGRPYRNDAERIANMEASRLAHLVALAKCLREGGRCQDFKSETVPWHGGSPAKLPLELALAFTDDSSLLTAEQCWAMVMTWRDTPKEPWPGLDGVRPPASANASMPVPDILPTGEPGRPTKGKQIYMAEHDRRCQQKEACAKIACEARYLADWFRATRPNDNQPTKRTIENSIRARHQQYKAQNHPQN